MIDMSKRQSITFGNKPSNKPVEKKIPPLVIDIISTGSLAQPKYHAVQQQAFSRYAEVRHFYPLTESNDTEVSCHSDLPWNRVKDALAYCRRRSTNHSYLDMIRPYFGITGNGNLIHYEHDAARGWLCAQKRPMDGLVKVMQWYKRQKVDALPDYLVFMDADTYMNITAVAAYLRQHAHSHIPKVLTGCLIWMHNELEGRKHASWSWTWGGYGTFFSKGTLQRMLQPIYCDDNTILKMTDAASTSFASDFCQQLQQNLIGEQAAFEPGMNLVDLMQRYTFRHRYADAKNWTDVGFCLHSDHIWTYFANYYFLSINPQSTNTTTFTTNINATTTQNHIYAYANDSLIYPMMRLKNPERERGQCLHRDDDLSCTADAHICHRISAQRMAELWKVPLAL